MSQEESVTTWLRRLKSGHSSAAPELWQRYVERLVRLARHKLGRQRRSADEEDVVLTAFDAFLGGVEKGRFARLDDRDDLWQVLLMLTDRKARELKRRERALKRGGGHVRGESVFANYEANGSSEHGIDQHAARQPTPEQAAEMVEQFRLLLDLLSDATQRQIALGKLEGFTNEELAQQLGTSVRSVERKLQIIRRKWQGAIQ